MEVKEVPDITMRAVESSQLESCGHCSRTNTLAIKFKGGGLYHYAGFAAEDWAKFQGAHSKSVGKHFHAHIRGKFPHTRMDQK